MDMLKRIGHPLRLFIKSAGIEYVKVRGIDFIKLYGRRIILEHFLSECRGTVEKTENQYGTGVLQNTKMKYSTLFPVKQ
jgi:hypothetical protein